MTALLTPLHPYQALIEKPNRAGYKQYLRLSVQYFTRIVNYPPPLYKLTAPYGGRVNPKYPPASINADTPHPHHKKKWPEGLARAISTTKEKHKCRQCVRTSALAVYAHYWYSASNSSERTIPMILEHLTNDEYQNLDEACPDAIVSAQIRTLEWHDEPVGPADDNAKTLARNTFASLTTPGAEIATTKANVLQLRSPAAVQHLVGMLSAYDWDFVEQAKELRGFVVAKLLEEVKGTRASDRLRALQLIGTLTEVASFTERSEVTHKQENTSEIEDRLRARLASLLPPVLEVQDTEVKEIAVVKHAAPETAAAAA